MLIAVLLGVGCYAWYTAHGATLLFNDARLREMIARRVVASRTPGLAQLGTTWLPLPSLMMLPLIWDNALFRDGFAGSLPSMCSYVAAALYMYRLGRLVSGSRAGGSVAAAALMVNPSLLYMQSTAMSETPSLAAFVAAVYYGVLCTRTLRAVDVVCCATAAATGTLIRYDNWVIAVALVPVLGYVGWRRRGRTFAEACTILYGVLAFAGCAAWVIYNWVIFHDPLLSFFYGNSAHTFYPNAPASLLPARGHPRFALVLYGLTVAGTVGWAMLPVAVIGLGVYIWRLRVRASGLAAYLTLLPFVFYWLVLYRGINTESLPQLGMGQYYNIRFGLGMIPAVALFSACLTMASEQAWVRRALVAAVLGVIIASSVAGSVAQTPFVLREARYGAGANARGPGALEARWLSAHYRGGNVLITYVNSPTMMFYLLTRHRFSDDALVTDANGPEFVRALAHPERSVRWVVMDSDASNGESRIWRALSGRRDWRAFFVLRRVFGTTEMYERLW